MPELPDLLYICDVIAPSVRGVPIASVVVKQPVVLRNAFPDPPQSVLAGQIADTVEVCAPFLRISFAPKAQLLVNLMLAGRLQLQHPGEKPEGFLCFSLRFANGLTLNLGDDQKMAKVYLVPCNDTSAVRGFDSLGINILDSSFTHEAFAAIARDHRRRQVRVLLTDHSLLCSIGNAYADEILFDAGIHPKTLVARLSDEDIARLYMAIRGTMLWGAEQVRTAARPIQTKVRDHLRVRNRHGKPCPRCGTTIRREGVRGYDVFFCPRCQPATRDHFIDWRNKV
jgi:formamidopyrimidine-DNA glycosylase